MADPADNTNGKEVSGLEKEKLEFEETEVKTTEEVSTTETPEVVEETFVEETEEVKQEIEEEVEDVDEINEEVDEGSDETETVEEFDETSAEEETEEPEEEHQSVSAIEDEDSTGTRIENSLNYSVTVDGVTKEFSVSLVGKLSALSELVNATYGEADNTWFDVDAYEDEKQVLFHDYWNNKHWRQSYKVKQDVYTLVGDRTEVFCTYLSKDEQAKFDKMKADFASIETELNSYKEKELHAAREAVINSEEYSVMSEFSEFTELKSHMDEYSVEELTNKADLIYAKFMKSNYSNFSSTNEPKKHSMVFMTSGSTTEEEKLPYGGLFKNFKGRK